MFCQLVNGDVVLLNLKNGMYYGLDSVGSRVWQLLGDHGDVERLVPLLLQEYEVSEEQLAKDVMALLEELCSAGLLEEVRA